MSRPTDITGSRRRRRRARTIRLGLRGLVVAALVATLAALTWMVGFSQVMAATTVEVRGTGVLTADTVVRAADVPLGTPLVRLATAPVAKRVASLAPVASVDVSRRWPHSVVITVVERKAVYVLRGSDQTLTLVDSAGIAYFSPPAAPGGLLSAKVARPDTRTLKDVATVVAALPAPVVAVATMVTADSVDNIVIELDGGRRLIWGSAEQSDLKAQVAAALLVTRASVYDVSAPSHPATRT